MERIVVATTDTVPGKKIAEVLGVIKAHSIILFSLEKSNNRALKRIKEKAEKMGADAIVGVKWRTLNRLNTVTGAAVKLKSE